MTDAPANKKEFMSSKDVKKPTISSSKFNKVLLKFYDPEMDENILKKVETAIRDMGYMTSLMNEKNYPCQVLCSTFPGSEVEFHQPISDGEHRNHIMVDSVDLTQGENIASYLVQYKYKYSVVWTK